MSVRSSNVPINNASTVSTSNAFDRHAAERDQVLNEYFHQTKLVDVLQAYVTRLASNFKIHHQLPANPYPSLLTCVRQAELKQAIDLHNEVSVASSSELVAHPQQPSTTDQAFHLVSIKGTPSVWCFSSVMERINSATFSQRLDLLRILLPTWFTPIDAIVDDGFQVSVYTAMVGDRLFAPIEHMAFVELERHVFVSGEQLEKGMTVFARHLFKTLHELSAAVVFSRSKEAKDTAANAVCVVCSDLIILTSTSSSLVRSTANGKQTLWSMERINSNRNTFFSAVKTALVSNSKFEITSFFYDTNREVFYQVVVTFLFHYTFQGSAQTKQSTSTSKSQKQQQHTQSNCSFLAGSSVLDGALFFQERGALEIVNRVQREHEESSISDAKAPRQKTHKVTPAVVISTAPVAAVSSVSRSRREQFGFSTVFQDTVEQLQQFLPVSGEFRRWMDRFLISFPYKLLWLSDQILLLLSLISNVDSLGPVGAKICLSFHIIDSYVSDMLEQTEVGMISSMMIPIYHPIHHIWQQIRECCGDESQLDTFIELLVEVNELLLVIARTTVNDFLHLVSDHSVGHNEPTVMLENMPDEQIDVVQSVKKAVQQRQYPPAIMAEAVFAQYMVDSCVDVALESAVMNTVAFYLPPNPFIELSQRLRVFASRQLVWNCSLSTVSCISTKPVVSYENDAFIVSSSGQERDMFGFNRRLLEMVNTDHVWMHHQWLQAKQIYYQGDYQPSKSSYSMQIFPSLLLFHPLDVASQRFSLHMGAKLMTRRIIDEIDVVEHFVVEGTKLSQALEFFADAVKKDLKRLASIDVGEMKEPVMMYLLDQKSEAVVSVDVRQSTNESLHQLIVEATTTKNVIQIHTTHIENAQQLTIHSIKKSYLFHYKSPEGFTDENTNSTAAPNLTPLVTFRLQHFGVFFSIDHLRVVQERVHSSSPHNHERAALRRDQWTPYAKEAFRNNDQLLVYQLEIATPTTDELSLSGCLNEAQKLVLSRLLTYSNPLPVYFLEKDMRWIFQYLQKNGEPVSTESKKNAFNTFCHQFLLQIINQTEEILVPLIQQMQYVDNVKTLLEKLRAITSQLKQSSATREQHNNGHVPVTNATDELVSTLRSTWLLVLYVRYCCQYDFFASFR